MKTKILTCIALSIALITAAATFPAKELNIKQAAFYKTPGPVFDFIRGHRQGKGVTITWGSSSNASNVNCFTLIRTFEDPTDPYAERTPVSNVPCNANRSYKFTDENVPSGFVSYRLVATLTSGGYEFSDIETIHLVQH
jgi:hypothetical protein